MWSKIRYVVRSIIKDSDDYDKKYMQIKFNSETNLILNSTIETYTRIIVVKAVSAKFFR